MKIHQVKTIISLSSETGAISLECKISPNRIGRYGIQAILIQFCIFLFLQFQLDEKNRERKYQQIFKFVMPFVEQIE